MEFPSENSNTNFSPLVIAIIAILASAFLLVSYYAMISKYCGNNNNSSRRRENHDPNEGLEERENPSSLEPWHVANNGLDEALIKSITVCKYKRGHGLIEGTDCSVCLSEFEEDESVRLLPKCSHAFHVFCIDTWLKSHSNCPLCRANIVSISLPPPPLPPPVSESPRNIGSLSENTRNEVFLEDIEMGTISGEETLRNGEVLKEENKDIVIEIKDENFKQVRRSVSMDFDHGERLSIADVLLINQNVEFDAELNNIRKDGVGSSSRERGLRRFNSHFPMKRSHSSGRLSFSKRGRGRNVIIPL